MIKININLKILLKKYIIDKKLYNINHKTKYTIDEILNVIEYILITGASWRSINMDIFEGKYNWQSIYYHYSKFCKNNVFKSVYDELLKKYFKKNRSGKLKYLSIDSALIKNECSSKVSYGYTKKKKISKLSLIVDANGVPISALLMEGNISDPVLMMDNLDDMFIEIDYCNINNNNKHKRYLLADKGYDSNKIRTKIKNMNITPIIGYNKRNTKNANKLKKLNNHEKKIYKKRIIVENVFSWLFKNRRINTTYDKKQSTYYGFLYMSFIKIILKRMD